MALKEYTYLTLTETADYLKMDLRVVGLAGTTQATRVVQDLTYTSVLLGTEGNATQIEYTAGGVAGAEVVTVTGQKISVQIDSGVSTANQIKTAVEASAAASALVTITVSGVGGNTQVTYALANLTGGAYPTQYDARVVRVLNMVINAACKKVEGIIDGPVLTREFDEEHDGSNSNVIKPHHWPVVSITELKVDYNRAFGSTSVLPAEQYFIRGGSDIRQAVGDVTLRVIGNDIVLRDDNETFVLGRIFSGSVLGSIKIKYKAGWGADTDDLPSDLKLATLHLTKYFWFQRENNDMNVASKSVKGESYTRMKDGIPEEIYETIEQYQDMSFGTRPVPQRNYFGV
jgi:hypothetical protein